MANASWCAMAKSEAGSARIAVAGLFETIEGLKDSLELAFGNARPVIEHADAGPPLRGSPYVDFCFPGEFERVVDEIRHDPPECMWPCHHHGIDRLLSTSRPFRCPDNRRRCSR